uniref:Pentatricopeptide repeat-containing protein n=1 Tax=Salix viminalis TaxID=40686 RepID=A0A6N2L9L0_SALVM
MMMLTRKSAFRATASDSRVLQQHMEMMFKLVFNLCITFTTLLNGLCNEGKIKDAVELFDEMVRRGMSPM